MAESIKVDCLHFIKSVYVTGFGKTRINAARVKWHNYHFLVIQLIFGHILFCVKKCHIMFLLASCEVSSGGDA